jgi:predicted transcriptional regulator
MTVKDRRIVKFQKLTWLKTLPNTQMSNSDHRVLVTIMNYADGDGTNAYPSIKTIAKDSWMSERTVQRSLASLKSLGLIKETERGGRDRGNRASVYSLLEPSPVTPDLHDTSDDLDDTSDGATRQTEQTYTTNSAEHAGKLYDTSVTPPGNYYQERQPGPTTPGERPGQSAWVLPDYDPWKPKDNDGNTNTDSLMTTNEGLPV